VRRSGGSSRIAAVWSWTRSNGEFPEP
jgi:hypothetical protein